jgi:hypothetical protein
MPNYPSHSEECYSSHESASHIKTPKGRKRRKITLYTILWAVLAIAFAIFFVVMLYRGYEANRPWNLDIAIESPSETYVVEGGTLIVLQGGPKVRSLQLASTYEKDYYMYQIGWRLAVTSPNTSYGRMTDKDNDGCVIQVNTVLVSYADPYNGPFIGIKLEDLDEAIIKLLPKEVEQDPDGIIWISSNYIDMRNVVKPQP